jgi:hypothetical protein
MGSWVLGKELLALADDLITRDDEGKLRLRDCECLRTLELQQHLRIEQSSSFALSDILVVHIDLLLDFFVPCSMFDFTPVAKKKEALRRHTDNSADCALAMFTSASR